jgi:hypothetical protein
MTYILNNLPRSSFCCDFSPRVLIKYVEISIVNISSCTSLSEYIYITTTHDF